MKIALFWKLFAVAAVSLVLARPAAAGPAAPGATAFAAAVPVADAQMLSDAELGAVRAGGFLDGLISALVGAISASTTGVLAGLPSAGGLLGGLPSLNLVQAQINDQPTITLMGTGPQSLTLTGPGYTIELSAGAGPGAQAMVNFSSSIGGQTVIAAAH